MNIRLPFFSPAPSYPSGLLLRGRSGRMMIVSPLILLLLVLTSCIPPSANDNNEDLIYAGVSIDLQDPITRKLADWQDQRQSDSLILYFTHDNASYRYLAARAFGSFSDADAQAPLLELLQDPVDLVRSAAAYALGQQLPASKELGESLIANFQLDSTNRRRESFSALLQAIGKHAEKDRLQQLATVRNYAASDTNLLQGTAWSIFYFARRGVQHERATQRALELAEADHPTRVRYPALAYLARYVASLDSSQVTGLIKDFANEPDADLRMLQVLAIGKYPGPLARNVLLRRLRGEVDWRVRTNLIRSLTNYPYPMVEAALTASLSDPHELVALRAAEALLTQGIPEDATTYWKLGRDSFPWPVRHKLYQAANQHLPVYFADYRGSINFQLQQRFQETGDVYEKAAIIEALSAFPWNYRNIMELGFESRALPVRTAMVRALATISGRQDFDAFFRSSSRRVRLELAAAFQRAIESGDPGMIYEAAQPLSATEKNAYLSAYPELGWARNALQALPLPEALESYRVLENAINVLSGQPPIEDFSAPAFSRPIDWESIADAGSNPTVRIHTSKGMIDLELWPELAPGTVSNFLRLAAGEFYKQKPFHRVVPNFVVQGGDPRGDGYGSVDFTIRTETPPLHWSRSGIIGMASAGRDTESVQFFITHSGTPHLDGNYTAFGEVIKGQEVVDALSVGDLIERVEIR